MIRPIKSRRLNVRETQMFKKYKQIKRCFTLVELLVAMAVFSVMLLLMMQFFSGAQRIWVSTEQKNNLYADARVAMDLISTFLQGTYFTQGGSGKTSDSTETQGIPFIITAGDDDGIISTPDAQYGKIYFPTQTQMDLIENAGKVVFATFQRGRAKDGVDNELRMAILTDSTTDQEENDFNFNLLFPPYSADNPTNYQNRTDVKKLVMAKLDNKIKEKLEDVDKDKILKKHIVLLDNVTSFKLIPIKKGSIGETENDGGNLSEDNLEEIPFIIEIQLSLMDKKAYDFWKELKASGNSKRAQEYRLQHEHTFTRAVYLGNRWNVKF